MNFTWDKEREDRVFAAVSGVAKKREARRRVARIGLPAALALVLLSVAFVRSGHGLGRSAGSEGLSSEGLVAADTALLANVDAGSKAD
jgi:hypothetical protein